MIRKLRNILKGNFAHWNTTQVKAIAYLYAKSKEFQGEDRNIAEGILAICDKITDTYLGPDRESFSLKKLSDREVKSLTYSDYLECIDVISELSLTLLTINLPYYKRHSERVYQRLFDKSLNIYLPDEIDSDYQLQVINEGLDYFINAAKILEQDPIMTFSFSGLVMNSLRNLIEYLTLKRNL